MPQIVDIILTVKKIRATLSLALRSDLWEKYNYSICQIHQLALCTCHSRKDSYWYSFMKDLNSLPLTTENSGLGSNFPFKILIFELRSFSPLKFPMVMWWAWIFSGATNLGTLCVHCCLGRNPRPTNCHMTWLPPERLRRRLHDNNYYYFISSFYHWFFSSFIFHHHIPKIIIV